MSNSSVRPKTGSLYIEHIAVNHVSFSQLGVQKNNPDGMKVVVLDIVSNSILNYMAIFIGVAIASSHLLKIVHMLQICALVFK